MKNIVYILLSAFTISLLVTTSSCKKDYKCTCTFNNAIIYTNDLGEQTKKNAQDDCNRNDSTVRGEVWDCSVD